MERTLPPDVVDGVRTHMNDDHADSVLAYAKHFGGIGDATEARIESLDALGMDLHAQTPDGTRLARIAFDHEVVDGTDARETLVAMARAAGVGANDEH